MKKAAIVYWLLPARPERELFCEFVRIFTKEFGAPNFEPHLTLFVSAKVGQSPKQLLQTIRSGPIRLNFRSVGSSAKFTKTLYLRFKPNADLRKLASSVARIVKSSARPPRDPHVSLIYKNMPRRTKKELAAMIKLPFRSARFDSIAAVRLTLPVRTAADVAKWKIVARKSLRR